MYSGSHDIDDRYCDGLTESSSHNVVSSTNSRSSDNINFKILVPSIAAGAIIGRRGEAIAKIQRETGAKIKLSKADDFYPGTTERVCLIQGTLAAVTNMHNYIMDKVYDRPDLSTASADVTGGSQFRIPTERHKQVKILVPNCTAGLVLGKEGRYVSRIKEATKAFIQVSQKSQEISLAERSITIAGEPHQLRTAVDMVLAKIAEDPQSSSCPNISYSMVRGPVASAEPIGSPFANTSATPVVPSSVTTQQLLPLLTNIRLSSAPAAAAAASPRGYEDSIGRASSLQDQGVFAAGGLAAPAQQYSVPAGFAGPSTFPKSASMQQIWVGSMGQWYTVPSAALGQLPVGAQSTSATGAGQATVYRMGEQPMAELVMANANAGAFYPQYSPVPAFGHETSQMFLTQPPVPQSAGQQAVYFDSANDPSLMRTSDVCLFQSYDPVYAQASQLAAYGYYSQMHAQMAPSSELAEATAALAPSTTSVSQKHCLRVQTEAVEAEAGSQVRMAAWTVSPGQGKDSGQPYTNSSTDSGFHRSPHGTVKPPDHSIAQAQPPAPSFPAPVPVSVSVARHGLTGSPDSDSPGGSEAESREAGAETSAESSPLPRRGSAN